MAQARHSPVGGKTVRADEPHGGLFERLRFVSNLLKEAGEVGGHGGLIYRQPNGGTICVPLEDKLIVGRSKDDCVVAVKDPKMSARHFCIRRKGEHAVLEDLGSLNGTWVNGRRVDKLVLCDGDVIEAGSVVFVFVGAL